MHGVSEQGRDRARAKPNGVLGTHTLGLLFIAALGLGGGFVWLALRLRRATTPQHASTLFHYSLLYLALFFTAIAVDPLL